MPSTSIEKAARDTYVLIDNLKALCTNYGLNNSGNEYKIITQTFLYKFLNDKCLHYLKRVDGIENVLPGVDLDNLPLVEKKLSELGDDAYDFLTMGLPENVAVFKPNQYISHLYGIRQQDGFHRIFDQTLLDIAEENKAVFSVMTGEGNLVRLFESISNYIVDPQKRDGFCSAIIDKLVSTTFDDIFEQGFDFFANIFEYLIGDYNKDSGAYAEYYTPHSIARIIADIIAKDGDHDVEIYDPAAGSGTLILTLANRIGVQTSTVYTQDISQKSNEILRLNLVLNNLVHSLHNVIQADTLVNPRHLNADKSIRQFDYVVSNPPFNMDFSETRNTLAGENYQKRFFAGVPNIPAKKPEKMAVYLMFLQHILGSMKPGTGRAAVVVPTGFLTASTGIPLKIRKHIIDGNDGHGILRAVVSMPSNIFANTGTNVSVLFLDNAGPAEDKVLLVDASNLGTKKKLEGTKNQRTYLSEDEMQRIVDTVNDRSETDDFSILVPVADIAKKKYSFSAGQYFKVKIEYVDLTPEEFQQKMAGYEAELKQYFDEGHKLEEEIWKGLGELKYEKM